MTTSFTYWLLLLLTLRLTDRQVFGYNRIGGKYPFFNVFIAWFHSPSSTFFEGLSILSFKRGLLVSFPEKFSSTLMGGILRCEKKLLCCFCSAGVGR